MFKTTPTLFVRLPVLLGEQTVIWFPANRADGFINVFFHLSLCLYLCILWIPDFDMHFYLLTTETRRAQRELYSCPIGRRRSGKRSQPCGHDLVVGSLHVNAWIQAKERTPEAEAPFPGRRLPAREKTTSSVYSVPLW